MEHVRRSTGLVTQPWAFPFSVGSLEASVDACGRRRLEDIVSELFVGAQPRDAGENVYVAFFDSGQV